MKGNFIDNLPKIYGIYTGGFIGFIIIMAIAEQMGMTAKTIGIAFVAFTVFIYALIGYLSSSVVTERARLLDVFFDVRNKYCAVRHAADSGGFDSQTPACSMIRRSERTWLRLRAVPEASASGRLNALWSDDRCKSR
jgi:hypothetical protein